MITRSRAARSVATILLAGAILVGTTGCVFITPAGTLEEYDPSDGVSATIGDVRVLNMLGIINEEGDAINLMATLFNGGRITNVDIQFESDGETTTITQPISNGESIDFGTTPDAENRITVLAPSVDAGDLMEVYVQQGDEPGELMLVPILEAINEYAELAPPAAG